jgi:hypothetical protein
MIVVKLYFCLACIVLLCMLEQRARSSRVEVSSSSSGICQGFGSSMIGEQRHQCRSMVTAAAAAAAVELVRTGSSSSSGSSQDWQQHHWQKPELAAALVVNSSSNSGQCGQQ